MARSLASPLVGANRKPRPPGRLDARWIAAAVLCACAIIARCWRTRGTCSRACGPADVAAVATTRDLAAEVESAGGTLAALREPAITASRVWYLDAGWVARSPAGVVINASVPGDLLTDLQRAGLVGDPLRELAFKTRGALWDDEWTYERSLADVLRALGPRERAVLVLESVKMAADVSVGGAHVARVTSQFVRTLAWLPTNASDPTLRVRFLPSALQLTRGRFMACSGGWDWAPYTDTFEGADHTFSKGLVRAAYVAAVPRDGGLSITQLVPTVHYRGAEPEGPLADGRHAGFVVRVRVFGFGARATAAARLVVRGSWGARRAINVSVPGWAEAGAGAGADGSRAGSESGALVRERLLAELELDADASAVRLWWPLRMGPRPLYTVSCALHARARGAAGSSRAHAPPARAERTIGFRVVSLATHGHPPAHAPAPFNGSGSVGMVLVVNGAAVFARGANVIPPEELEGRTSAPALLALVRSAAAAGMNTLRVWGGGAYLPAPFYAAADRVGVLIYHDLMFTTTSATHEPHGTAEEAAEVAHAVRSLAHHPSVALWSACNECDPGANPVYSSLVMSAVAREDDSRPIWPASPSRGWASGVDPLSSRPDGSALRARPLQPASAAQLPIEVHGPYVHGNGWPAVNQVPIDPTTREPSLELHAPRMPLPLPGSDAERPAMGAARASTFVSEFGVTALSSFESMAPTLDSAHWGVHGGAPDANCTEPDRTNPFWLDCSRAPGAADDNPLAERNYPCDPQILSYFPAVRAALDAVGERPFRAQLYLCLLAHALEIKAEIEAQRARNTLGSLLWQLNEIWPTGGWGTLEYSASVAPGAPFTAGQVLGGRWKPAHHLLQQHLFADVLATCGARGVCYVRSDAHTPLRVSVRIEAHPLSAAAPRARAHELDVSLGAGPAAMHWFELPASVLGVLRPQDVLLSVRVREWPARRLLSAHTLLLVPPAELAPLPPAKVSARVGAPALVPSIADGPRARRAAVRVELVATDVAAYTCLSTLAWGHFEPNCVHLRPSLEPRVVHFFPHDAGADANRLEVRPSVVAELEKSLHVEHLQGALSALLDDVSSPA